MKRLFLLSIFAASTFAFSVTAYSQSPEYTRSRIERLVQKEILSLPYYGVFDAIGYSLNNGTVTLTGYVVRPLTKRDAESAVRDVPGVTNVVNSIEVLPVSPSDERIRRRTLQTLASQGGSLYRYFLGANPSIRIIVNRGRISLEGYADSRGDANRAYILARTVPGTFGVTNNLKVLEGPR
jgi:hyperosmotically inducible protein